MGRKLTEEGVVMNPGKRKDLVLIVDDSAYMRNYLSALLEQRYNVKTAKDGEDGFLVAVQLSPSLILTDVIMPKMDGYELLKKLRKNKSTRNIPVILLTSSISQASVIKGIELGADDYIAKPVLEKELLARVKNYLELHHSRQKELRDELEHEKNINRQKDEFIEIAGHEFKTPLTCLSGYVQLLDSVTEEGDTLKREYIKRSREQISVLTALINDLVNITKLQTGQLEYNFNELNIYSFVKAQSKKLEHQFPSHRIVLTGDGNAIVRADEKLLDQVLLNYISNAVKYSPNSHLIEVKITNNKSDVEVVIEDSGIGIPKDQMENLFKKFYRVDHKNASGIGLGLYISSEIIKKHKGRTWAESVYKQGSRFYFSLPLS